MREISRLCIHKATNVGEPKSRGFPVLTHQQPNLRPNLASNPKVRQFNKLACMTYSVCV